MNSPLSIVIPSHNRPDLLAECLTSLARFSPSGTEVLVVDDASPGAIVSRTALEYPNVQVLRLDTRRGFCGAVNAGVAAVCGELVELLNDDTLVTAGWAEAALARFTDPAIAAVTPLVLQGGPEAAPTRVDSTGDVYHRWGIARKRGHGEILSPHHLQSGPVFGASGSSSFFRRAVYQAVGGLPEEFVAYFDDVDLSFRLQRAGWQVYYEPASRVYHRVSSSHGPPQGDLLRLQSRNEELVFWRNHSVGELVSALPGHAAVLAGKAVRRWREGQLTAWLRGRMQAWRSLGKAREQPRTRLVPRQERKADSEPRTTRIAQTREEA